MNYLVGPNGSGKSRFAGALIGQLENSRLLGTDRLQGLEQSNLLSSFRSDPFPQGFSKERFRHLKQAGRQGSGVDAFVLLEERMDLRIQVEATLSHLFDREISLEWDSGNLVPQARRRGDSITYRLDRDECHGIKELLILLTHLYDTTHHHLVIDEPELNLHPQYQAFFMQEVRRVAGDPAREPGKKIIFLITHSPFILDLRTEDDLNSVISFDLQYSSPKQVACINLIMQSSSSFIRKLNSHHKQLFFSDNPVFVEGVSDAWLVEAIMNARGESVAGAGSCIIDCSGVEQVNQYMQLCRGLGKSAHFLYDLDSLFSGSLRGCIGEDSTIRGFLLDAGLGDDFVRYCGQLDQKLTTAIDLCKGVTLPDALAEFGGLLSKLGERGGWEKEQWAKARTAVMVAISRYRGDVSEAVGQELVDDISGRWSQIPGVAPGPESTCTSRREHRTLFAELLRRRVLS